MQLQFYGNNTFLKNHFKSILDRITINFTDFGENIEAFNSISSSLLKEFLQNNIILSDECFTRSDGDPITSSYHTIKNFGYGSVMTCLNEILNKLNQIYPDGLTINDVSDVTQQTSVVNNLRQALENYKFEKREAFENFSKDLYFPIICELVDSYLTFLQHGNAGAYSDGHNQEDDDMNFMVCISKEIYNFYKFLFVLRHSVIEFSKVGKDFVKNNNVFTDIKNF